MCTGLFPCWVDVPDPFHSLCGLPLTWSSAGWDGQLGWGVDLGSGTSSQDSCLIGLDSHPGAWSSP